MALATQCPHCHTTFRVAHDQLKLRAGLVRCGACKQIFNGIENLLRPEELEQATGWHGPAHPPPSPAPTHEPSENGTRTTAAQKEDESATPPAEAAMNDSGPAESRDLTGNDAREEDAVADAVEEARVDARKDDPLLRMTLMDFAHERRGRNEDNAAEPASSEHGADPIEQAIDDLENKPWRREQDASAPADDDALDRAEAVDYEEPSFVKQGRRKQRIGRALRVFIAAGSAILLLTLLGQGAYIFRDRIAAWFPQTKPVLAEACAYLGCQVGLPAQIESVSIESSELQAFAPNSNAFALTVLLRNHGATAQAWPHLELTLNDANEKPVARRVFSAREYLPGAQDPQKGFAARSEQPVKLFFELSQVKASGYRVYLFYP